MKLTYVYVAIVVLLAVALVVWRAKVVQWARDGMVFAGEVRSEIEKVTWPDKLQLRNATFVILGFVVLVAIVIGALDVVLQWILVTLPGRVG